MAKLEIKTDFTKNHIQQIGDHFFRGVLRCFFREVCWIFVVALAITLATTYFKPLDDCDRTWWDRCGMSVLKDAKTGKEYLVFRNGGIVERGVSDSAEQRGR